jgi:hypothetical protein
MMPSLNDEPKISQPWAKDISNRSQAGQKPVRLLDPWSVEKNPEGLPVGLSGYIFDIMQSIFQNWPIRLPEIIENDREYQHE